MTSAPKMASIMLQGMFIMMVAAWMYSIAVVLVRVRRIIREREQQTAWLREMQAEEVMA
jgi:heme exporter protein C